MLIAGEGGAVVLANLAVSDLTGLVVSSRLVVTRARVVRFAMFGRNVGTCVGDLVVCLEALLRRGSDGDRVTIWIVYSNCLASDCFLR